MMKKGFSLEIDERLEGCRSALERLLDMEGAPVPALRVTFDEALTPEHFRLTLEGGSAAVRARDGRGAAYAACELLDRAQAGVLPEALDVQDGPGDSLRVFNQHAPALLSDHLDALSLTKRYMDYALRRRANTFILAQNWPVHLDDALQYKYVPALARYVDEERSAKVRAAYREALAYARSLGLDMYVTTTELRFPLQALADVPGWMGTREEAGHELQPHANPCPVHPQTRAYVQGKIREACELMPEAAGIELWMGEKQNSIFYCQCERCRHLDAPRRALMLIQWVYEAMKAGCPHMKLIVRTYLCAGRCSLEPDVFLPIADELPADVIVAVKGQYGDVNYRNDPHPLVGAFPRDMIVEFDLGGEYRAGLNGYFSGITAYVEERMRLYRGRGAKGFAVRHVDWLGDVSISEADTFFAMGWNPAANGPATQRRLLARRYAQAGADALCSLLRLGEEIVRCDLHILGLNAFGCFGFLPETLTRTQYNVMNHCARMTAGGEARIRAALDDETAVLCEKERAAALCDEFLAVVEQARGTLPDSVLDPIETSGRIMRACVPMHRIAAQMLLCRMRLERSLYIDERLHEAHRLRKLAAEAQAWLLAQGEELRRVNLQELSQAYGAHPFKPFGFGASGRLPVDNIQTLLQRLQAEYDPIYDFFTWNIII